MIPALEALDRLRQGNARYVADSLSRDAAASPSRRVQLTSGQEPFAIVLGCSDSRVPAELVFDQGLGDLFVIRVAGNIVAPSQIGSVEFAADRFGTRLVVVLGHTGCGAIQAALEQRERKTAGPSTNMRSIVDRIQASIGGLGPAEAVRANIRASADHLRHGSEILERLVAGEGLAIVGAEYSLETGVVDFFDGVPGAPR